MKSLFCFIFIGFIIAVKAQYGNEWINYNQSYYSFKVASDGIYKIDYNTLNASGFPITTPTEQFQLWAFEKEQGLFLQDGGDNSFDPGDYMLFYGQKNNIWLDSLLYDDPSDIANKYFPHYNDTITYFLTINPSGNNKRILTESDVNYLPHPAKPYVLDTKFAEFHSAYVEGFKNFGLSYSEYVNGEGWSTGRFNALGGGNFLNTIISTPQAYTGANAPDVFGTAVSSGASNAPVVTNGNHHVQLKNQTANTTLADLVYTGYQKNELDFSFPVTDLGSSATIIRHEFVNDLQVTADQQVVHYIELTYPRTTNLGGLSYFDCDIENGVTGKAHYAFSNASALNPIVFVIDGHEITNINLINASGLSHALISNVPSGKQTLIFADESAIIDIASLEAVNGTGNFIDYSNISFESASVLISHPLLWNGAQAYADYRSSVAGGNYNTVLVDVNELYLQFGGGVPKHVIGLRRFQHFIYNQTVSKPNHVFLIGKGIREATEGSASGAGMRTSSTSYNNCLVPTYGYPASDILISAHLEGNGLEPLIPIGRLAASTNTDVVNYLDKVKAFELAQDPASMYTIPSKLWQKEVLHFGGGTDAFEQNLFRGFLKKYENILEDSNFGGNATSFYKTVSDPINPVTLTEVNENINNGVSFMTFFGHASATGFDQNVDDPQNWNNKGKYPIVIGNSCLTGNIHEPLVYSTSENFVLIPEKGTIAFLATVNQGFPFGLDNYSTELFNQISGESYGKSIGEQLKITCANLNPTSFTISTTISQMTLHGDPALKANPHDKPEIVIEPAGVFITPETVDLTIDSIDVNIVLYNLGRSVADTFRLDVTRFFPNNAGDSSYALLIPRLDYIDTVTIRMPLLANLGIGINQFDVKVDIPGVIDEQYDEVNNNQVSKSFLFDIDGLLPIWPYNYAVVPEDSITVKASTVNPFADILSYRFEIDTTDLYNSPEFRQHTLASLGGVLEVPPTEWKNNLGNNFPLILEDSTVYFWRVTLDEPGNYNWQEFSFQYIEGRRGWGQDHFFQFKRNDFNGINYDRDSRTLTFDPVSKTVEAQTYGNSSNLTEFAGTLWKLDGEEMDAFFCNTNPKLLVGVIDPITLTQLETRAMVQGNVVNPDHNFGNSNDMNSFNNCRTRPERFFAFEQHMASQLSSFESMVTNDVPDGHYILVYTARFLNYPAWDTLYPQMYTLFQNLGSDSIQQGKSIVPYICFFKKGDPSSFKEVYGQDLNEFIEFADTIRGFDNRGFETSTLIGPARRWKSLHWQQSALETPTGDSTRLRLYGQFKNSNPTLILDTLFTNHDSILNLESIPGLSQFPLLRLEMLSIDEPSSTSAQLDGWHVLYDPVPEAAITSTNGYVLSSDSLQEGDKILVQFDIKNVSDYDMDSLLVNYWIERSNHQLMPIAYPRQDSLRVGSTLQDTLIIPTNSLTALNSLWVEVNPYNSNQAPDQPEMYHFNNIGQIPFQVSNDNENPILQVSFDNRMILNGDLVSPTSEIVITLRDENPFLLLDSEADTALFGIYLTDPNGLQKRLNFNNANGEQVLEWIPATVNTKKFQIVYQADFEQDGIYRLLVQGADKSGNVSGDLDYNIEFEVDHESTITNLMNYPNPFSTQTQFVFTLTGSEIPDEFNIQILTVSGKLVRTITRAELGPIYIGRNITEYRWDGKDEFGDQLANGVYLYRVKTAINGESIDLRESGADTYITKGFGKMYLLR